jgi:hypothetical protein
VFVGSYMVGSWPLSSVVSKNLGPVSPMYTPYCAPPSARSHCGRYVRGGANALFLTVSTGQQKEQLVSMQVRVCQ